MVKSFAKRMRDRGIQVEIGTNLWKQNIAAAVSQAIILGTPVDTGQARGNWLASLGSPISTASTRTDKSGGGTIARNMGIIRAATLNAPIYITNNVGHIQRLNDGWSAQAPAGFVESAILAGEITAKRMKVFK